MITLNSLIRLEEDGLITLNSNESLSLFIANYTTKVQYNNLWTDLLLQCRGLIISDKNEIIARPFPKFFNLKDHTKEDIPKEGFEVYEKLDGSLGILYFDKKWKIASRGSLNSEQADNGTRILYSKYDKYLEFFKKDKTYLFEIIYPLNRIVLDYGEKESLVLLAIIDTQTGKEESINEFNFPEKAKRYSGINELEELRDLENDEKEGFVVKFKSGFRVKVKFKEYLRLHKLLTDLSSKVIWEYLMEGREIEDILSKVPDEFYDWVKEENQKLKKNHERLYNEIVKKYGESPNKSSRKEFAQWARKEENSKLLFDLFDGKNIDQKIWKLLKPKYQNHYQSKLNKKL